LTPVNLREDYHPLAESKEAEHEYGISLTEWSDLPDDADAIILAIGHNEYLSKSTDELLVNLKPGGVVVDVKSALDREAVSTAGYSRWRL